LARFLGSSEEKQVAEAIHRDLAGIRVKQRAEESDERI
jgi:hypothetical protein